MKQSDKSKLEAEFYILELPWMVHLCCVLCVIFFCCCPSLNIYLVSILCKALTQYTELRKRLGGGGLVAKSRPVLCDPMHYSPLTPLSMEFPKQDPGVGCQLLLQQIFLTPGVKPTSPTTESPRKSYQGHNISQISMNISTANNVTTYQNINFRYNLFASKPKIIYNLRTEEERQLLFLLQFS